MPRDDISPPFLFRASPSHGAMIIGLTPELYRFAVVEERDPLTAEMAGWPGMEAARCNRWGYAMVGRGRVLAASGVVPIHVGRAVAWLLVSRECRPRELVPAMRYVRRWLDRRQRDPMFRRIEAHVRLDLLGRQGLMEKALAFDREGIARAWDPLGRDYVLYARVRP